MARVRVTRLSQAERATYLENVAGLLIQLSWVAQKQFSHSIAQHQLTFPQFLTLAFLAKAEQHCSMNKLAEATHQDAATMTGVVDRLERLGLVERTRSLEDRRVVLVRPTSRGTTLLATIKSTRTRAMSQLLEAFDDASLCDLTEQLEQLWKVLETKARRDQDASC